MKPRDHFSSRIEDIEPAPPVQVITLFSGEFFSKQVGWQVIVEMWEKRTFGRVKRAFQKEFTDPNEVRLLGEWYKRFYDWMFRTGTPRQVRMETRTLHLLQRAANFFGTV